MDFTRLPISRQNFHILKANFNTLLINLKHTIGLQLFSNSMENLPEIEKLRSTIFKMYGYINQCRYAKKDAKIKAALESPTGLFLNHHYKKFSLNELVEIETGKLAKDLLTLCSIFKDHIKRDCMLCYGRGHICRICFSNKSIFPFQKSAFGIKVIFWA